MKALRGSLLVALCLHAHAAQAAPFAYFTHAFSGRISVLDAADNTVTTNYDLLSRVTDTTEENGTDDIFTQFIYDDDSRTVSRGIQRNPGASTYQQTSYEYDERSRLTVLRRPDNDIWTYTYDANSNRLSWTDPLDTTVTDTYDERNLVVHDS